jgi:uncharacterized glyoxalase superfamily protein PhnB
MENRSMPPGAVIPKLAYPDVREAADWLCRAFGFSERLRIGNHRAQLVSGTGSIIVTQRKSNRQSTDTIHAVMVCVVDVDAHHEQAMQSGAKITSPPTNYPFGERQYSAEDPGGHQWIFSQTIANINPQDWGGTLIEPGG